MSYSDEESEHEVAGEERGEDAMMMEFWAKKARRRSSDFKGVVGDNVGLQDNTKFNALMAKNGNGLIQLVDWGSARGLDVVSIVLTSRLVNCLMSPSH